MWGVAATAWVYQCRLSCCMGRWLLTQPLMDAENGCLPKFRERTFLHGCLTNACTPTCYECSAVRTQAVLGNDPSGSMKFSQYLKALDCDSPPEWRTKFLNYKALKKELKSLQ